MYEFILFWITGTIVCYGLCFAILNREEAHLETKNYYYFNLIASVVVSFLGSWFSIPLLFIFNKYHGFKFK